MASSDTDMHWKAGGCHCGAVRFEVQCSDRPEVLECNCSICAKVGYLHLIVEKAQFRPLKGADELTAYSFNTKQAKHLFCRICGIKSFYVPRSHPDKVSVNYRCLDQADLDTLRILPFDGQNWEESAAALLPTTTQHGS